MVGPVERGVDRCVGDLAKLNARSRAGRGVRRAVEVRDLDAGRLEVLDGLTAGELVLAGPNLRRVRDGAPVVLQGSDVAL